MEGSLKPTIAGTETWKAWRKRYSLVEFDGKRPEVCVNAVWAPISPDTYDSMMADLRGQTKGIPGFSDIQEELKAEGVSGNMEHYSAFASAAVMQFFRMRGEE